VVATDSGAYQILQYGEVKITPSEIIEYQELLQTDIGVILDVPTGSGVSRNRALGTVNETLRRAKDAHQVITRRDIRWVGPIQGGQYPDLVAYSARMMAKMPFDIYALGSPTEVMEQYLFADLVDMILAAKTNLPSNVPFHLFGAGHPFMLALAVALGCDTFDSAAYILYARRGRYLTPSGTMHLGEMTYFPCRCNACAKTTPIEMKRRTALERTCFLAEHNLSASMQEIATIKEAISEGRLWELVEIRCRGHPSLLAALRRTKHHQAQLRRYAPSTKHRGILFLDSTSLQRPEYQAYLERLLQDYVPPSEAEIAILVQSTRTSRLEREKSARKKLAGLNRRFHMCFYSPPYGVVPLELEDTFPFSQTESTEEPDSETIVLMAESLREYLSKNRTYQTAVFVQSGEQWQNELAKSYRRACTSVDVEFLTFQEHEVTKRRIEIIGERKIITGKAAKTRKLKRRKQG
jgi:7-cyano-7-deazaguanine tRNA-ribosyltransferase